MFIAARLAVTTLFFATAIPLTANAGVFTTLYTFTNNADGGNPSDGQLIYQDGSIYGTTVGQLGSSRGYGNIFKVNAKTGRFKVVYSLKNGSDGAYPSGGVISANGLLYGTTFLGGGLPCSDQTCGTIFSVDPVTGAETTLYTAPQGTSWELNQLVYLAGSLYGTAPYGGSGLGSIFSLNLTTNSFTTVHTFTGGADGRLPTPGLLYQNGLFYGMTIYGGGGACSGNGCGTIFSIDPGTNLETMLHSFENKKKGAFPLSNLVYHGGSLFGATSNGGKGGCKYGCGVTFSVNADTGVETVLEMNKSYADSPWGLAVVDGQAYETLPTAGSGAGELVERDLKSGHVTVLYTFTGGADGSRPTAPLLYRDRAFYGTTVYGGDGFGTVFKFVP